MDSADQSTPQAACDCSDAKASSVIQARTGGRVKTEKPCVELDVRGGAISQDTKVSVIARDNAPQVPDMSLLTPGYDFSPDGLYFDEPARITIWIHPRPAAATLAKTTIVSVSPLGVVTELENISHDEGAGTVSGDVTHFTVFYAAMLGTPAGAGVTPGGPSVSVGGPNLSPLFMSVGPGNTGVLTIKVGPNSQITCNEAPGSTTVLFIQVDSGNPAVDQQIGVDFTIISPALVSSAPGPSQFWTLIFSSIVNGLRIDKTGPNGVVAHAELGNILFGRMLSAPTGYSEGRGQLVIRPDPTGNPNLTITLDMTLDLVPPPGGLGGWP